MKSIRKSSRYLIKLFLLIFLPLAGLLAVLLAVFSHQIQEEGRFRLINDSIFLQNIQLTDLQGRIDQMIGDFYYLSQQTDLFAQLVKQKGVTKAQTRQIFQFTTSRRWIDQFRFLDLEGNELFRIDQPHPDTPILIPPEQLQNKKSRPYFRAALQLDPQKFGISQISLNREHGRIEVPFRLMFRLYMSIFDQKGRIGVLVVNFKGDELFVSHHQYPHWPGVQRMLFDRNTHYLIHPKEAYRRATALDKQQQFSFKSQHPAAWGEMSSQTQGVIRNNTGTYIFHVLDLSTTNLHLYPIQPSGDRLPRWTWVSFAPTALLTQIRRQQIRPMLGYYGVLVGLLALLSLLFAARQRRLRESLAQNQLNRTQLKNKIRQLDCLYRISHLTETETLDWGEVLTQVVAQVPDGWPKNMVGGVKLTFNEKTWETEGFSTTRYQRMFTIVHDSCELGSMRVGYLKTPTQDEFSQEEAQLLEAITHRIVKLDQIKRVKEELRFHQLSLETQVMQRTEQLGQTNQKLLLEIKQKEALAQSLEQERKKTEEAMKTKSNFLSLVVHDLKSPFFSLLGVLRRIVKHEPNLNPKHRQLLQNSIESGQSLLKMVDKLIAINKIQTGKIDPEYQEVHLAQLIDPILNQFQGASEQKGIVLTHYVPSDIQLVTDPFLLGEVINNLVSNALKFCTAGDKISLKVDRQEGFTLVVEDTGLGIEPERIPLLFKENNTSSTLGTLGEKGSGLGLAYCSDVMQLLEGNISVKSQVNQGSQFCIHLPQRG